MLSECDIFLISNLTVKSDNCFSQYKCAKKFYGLSQIANQFNVNVIFIFVIAGHGKGEVDQVGGLAKNTIRPEVAAEKNFSNANDIVHYLSENMLKVNHQFIFLSKFYNQIWRLKDPNQDLKCMKLWQVLPPFK